MDLLREWIVRIAGIIILFTLCDMIMIEGTMKKYIKPIFGIVLVLAVIRPLSGDITDSFDFEKNYSAYETELSDEMTSKQKKTVRELYEKKLAEEVEKLIKARYGTASTVKVVAEEKEENFGNIDLMEIKLDTEEGTIVNTEEIKRYLEKELGTEENRITVKL